MSKRSDPQLNFLQIGLFTVVGIFILSGFVWGLLTWNLQKGMDLYVKEVSFFIVKPVMAPILDLIEQPASTP